MKRTSGESLWWVYLIALLGVLLLGGACGAMQDGGIAIRAAEASGYTEVKVTDRHNFFPALQGCSGGDVVGFDVTAKNPQGNRVNILVCSGIFKAATVRVR